MVHDVITLYYITAAEAQGLIEPILSENGQVAATTPAMGFRINLPVTRAKKPTRSKKALASAVTLAK